MTTVLVVVPKKSIQKFLDAYMTMLTVHNEQDIENWQKRTRANITHQNQNIEDEDERNAIIDEEYRRQDALHKARIDMPGVIPKSARFLDLEDPEGNQLFRLTVMKEDVDQYMKVLKKNGYLSQHFVYDEVQYVADKKLEAELKQNMKKLMQRILLVTQGSF